MSQTIDKHEVRVYHAVSDSYSNAYSYSMAQKNGVINLNCNNWRNRYMTEAQFDRRTKHTQTYYMALLTALIAGVTAKLSRQDFVEALNHQEIKSPTGADWNVNSLTMTLRSLHSNHNAGSYVHTAMLALTFDGMLTKQQCLCLLTPTNNKPSRM